MSSLQGRRALVIGAGSVGEGVGNGRATAMLLARRGAELLCTDRDLEAARDTLRRIEADGGIGVAFQLDATDVEAVASLAAHKPIDILIHVVGMNLPGGVVDTRPDDWDRVIDVNLRSAYLAARASLPGMLQQGSGAVVFVSSLAAVWSSGYSYMAYEAAKAGLNRLTRSLARAHAAQGVRVNAVMPGMIDTPHVRAFVSSEQGATSDARAAAVPMQRQGSPWEVAETIAFLASDAASYVTGTCLAVDGGLSA